MTGHYAHIAFTASVREHQLANGSAAAYDRMAAAAAHEGDILGDLEVQFIESRDSFFLASVGETGWPYVQHRGGPPGFLRVVDERTLGFVDFRGNRQYVTRGNVDHDSRVSLFLIDYALQARMKIFGRARVIERGDDHDLIARLTPSEYRATIERAFMIDVEAFDWNCRQHIPRLYPADAVEHTITALKDRVTELDAQLALALQRPHEGHQWEGAEAGDGSGSSDRRGL